MIIQELRGSSTKRCIEANVNFLWRSIYKSCVEITWSLSKQNNYSKSKIVVKFL